MSQAILKAVAQDNHVSFDEVKAAYYRLNSIDAIMVAIELSVVTERSFNEAIEVVCESSQKCANRYSRVAH
jgi:prefoldin subunit 5